MVDDYGLNLISCSQTLVEKFVRARTNRSEGMMSAHSFVSSKLETRFMPAIMVKDLCGYRVKWLQCPVPYHTQLHWRTAETFTDIRNN